MSATGVYETIATNIDADVRIGFFRGVKKNEIPGFSQIFIKGWKRNSHVVGGSWKVYAMARVNVLDETGAIKAPFRRFLPIVVRNALETKRIPDKLKIDGGFWGWCWCRKLGRTGATDEETGAQKTEQ